MLPGIRFLCAAVILAVSLVIFGMGAAALLRSAHEEFASLPNRRPPPTTVFSRQPETAPTLAMLRIEARTPETPAALPATDPVVEPPAAAAPASTESEKRPEEVPVAAAPPEPAPAAPEPEQALPPEPAPLPPVADKPAESSMVVAAAPATLPEPAQPAPETPPAAAAEPDTTASVPEPATTLTDEDARLSSSKVAVLGGPPVDTEPVPLPNARPTPEPPNAKVEKKTVKKTVVKKRRVAARAAPPPAAAAQQDPFGLSQLR